MGPSTRCACSWELQKKCKQGHVEVQGLEGGPAVTSWLSSGWYTAALKRVLAKRLLRR